MLAFYDEDQNPFNSESLFMSIDGSVGGVIEKKVYIRNSDVSRYYTDILLSIDTGNYSDLGIYGTSGWGFKLMYGERRPTDAEWAGVISNSSIVLPDIGDTSLADTFTYHPVWIRVFCPGGESAHIRETTSINLVCNEKLVGS